MTIALDDYRIGTGHAGFAPTRTTYRIDRPAAAPVRLTHRGRLALVGAALMVITALGILFGSSVAATDDAPGEVSTITVQPGQTLWSIAADARPNADIRETVDEIMQLNALENGSKLPIGATLAVPVD